MGKSHATPTFERLPAEKRQRLLAAAKRSFAENGFAATNINRVAQSAGISIGSLYKYFRSKEDLFLTIVEQGHDLLETVLGGIVESPEPLRKKVESLLRSAVSYSRKDPDFVRIYIDCTTQGLAPLAARLSRSIESIAALAYRRLIAEAQRRGELDRGLDPAVAAFCMDNLLLMIQYSFGSSYYRERLALFCGKKRPDAEAVIAGSALFIANALGCREKGRARR